MYPLAMTIVPDRNAVRSDEVSEIDLLIDIQAQTDGIIQESGPLCLAISLDRSGSMAGEKLNRAKEAIKYIVKTLRPDDRLTIIVFDDEANVVSDIDTRRSEVARQVDEISVGGCTNIILGWYMALLELQRTEAESRHIVLISDGLSNRGIVKKTEVRSEAAKAADIGITTSTIGIGKDCDQDFLEALTNGSGGRFTYAESGDLDEIIEEEFGTSHAVIVPRPFAVIELPAGATIVQEFHDFRKVGERIRLSPIAVGEKHGIAFRVKCDPAKMNPESLRICGRLFNGQNGFLECSVEIPVVSFSDYVEAETFPLVGAFIQAYLSKKGDEKFEEATNEEDFALAQSIILQEINGLKVAQEKLDVNSERHYYERDRMSLDLSVKHLSSIINDLQSFFQIQIFEQTNE